MFRLGIPSVLVEILSALLLWLYEKVKFSYHQGFRDGRRRLPPIRSPILLKSASELARMIVDGRVSSESVLLEYADRARAVNSLVNAIADQNLAKAVATAREKDAYLKICESKAALLREQPFYGVPFTVKETIAAEGLCSCIGFVDRKHECYKESADVVVALQEAGGIVLCSTNVPEASMWIETSNLVHGRTNNPYDLHRTCGGSSGGEAALLGAGGSVIGIGSDLAGSIRTPAAFCGVFGHKPTQGVVSLQGTHPVIPGPIKDFPSPGPMTRYAEDLLPMLKLLSRNDERLNLDSEVNVGSLRVHFVDTLTSLLSPGCNPAQENAVRAACGELRSTGCEVTPFHSLAFRKSFDLCFARFHSVETLPLNNAYRDRIRVLYELLKKLIGWSQFTVYASMITYLERDYRSNGNSQRHRQDLNELSALGEQLQQVLTEDAVLILPAQWTPAPFHHGTYLAPRHYWGIGGIWNVLNLPVTVCPLVVEKGLPVAVAIVAGRFQDRLCISVAQHLERAFGGWTLPCEVELDSR